MLRFAIVCKIVFVFHSSNIVMIRMNFCWIVICTEINENIIFTRMFLVQKFMFLSINHIVFQPYILHKFTQKNYLNLLTWFNAFLNNYKVWVISQAIKHLNKIIVIFPVIELLKHPNNLQSLSNYLIIEQIKDSQITIIV